MISQDKQTHNLNFLYQLLDGDKEKIAQIASLAVSSMEKEVEGIYAAYEYKDAKKAHDHLHKLKSNLANLDFWEVSANTPSHHSDEFWHLIPNYLRDVQISISVAKEALKRL